MCLIVDVNIAHKVFLADDDPDFGDIHRVLFTTISDPARMVYSQHLLAELAQNHAVRRLILRLEQMGRARLVPSKPIDADIEVLRESGLCRSNDLHILALARVHHIGLLVSEDGNLATDFTNKRILDSPRGNVYKKREHRRLLLLHCGIRPPRRSKKR